MRDHRALATWAACLAAVTALAVAAWAARNVTQPPDDGAPAVLLTAPTSPAYTPVPEADVGQVHQALHGVGDACATDPSTRSRVDPGGDVDAILDFVRRHPRGSFQIDDENGTALSLLLVLRDELRTCDPTALPRVDALLPPDIRRAVTADP